MLFHFFSIAILISILYKDYDSDKGKFTKAKIIHGFLAILLIYKFSIAFRQLGWVVNHSERYYEMFYKQIGLLLPVITFTHSIVTILSYAIGAVLVLKMAKRSDKVRKQFLMLLPVFTFTELVDFYKGFVGEEGYIGNHYFPLAIGFVYAAGVCSIIHLIYSSALIGDFFSRNEVSQETKYDKNPT